MKPTTGVTSRDQERLLLEFACSAPDLARCPAPAGPEVAIAGRSNAGKSSVLNRLTGNRHMAKVSKTPGRTQLLNFFRSRGGGYLVDLPGYGYAKAGRDAQSSWQEAVNDYLNERLSLSALVLVQDIRHPDQPFDRELADWAGASELPLLILANKADKLKQGARQQALNRLRNRYQAVPTTRVELFSAQTGLGLAPVLAILRAWLEGAASD